MYMNQMGKVPLLTREQEVEICKKIEEAEVAMKSIIYGLGFTAKEHIAIAEKLLSEPPKERFDRVIVDKKVANREGHLRDLRKLIKKLRAFDQKVDEKYFSWQKSQQKSRKEKMQRELKKMGTKLQEMFAKFYYKQKVVEEMIVVAGNVYEKFQASARHIMELEAQRTTAERRATIEAEHAKISTLEQFVRMPREEFIKVFGALKAAADRGLKAKTHMAEAAVGGGFQRVELLDKFLARHPHELFERLDFGVFGLQVGAAFGGRALRFQLLECAACWPEIFRGRCRRRQSFPRRPSACSKIW